MDNLHSIYVDQWDWEKRHHSREDRNVRYLKETVRDIVGAICDTSAALRNGLPCPDTSSSDRDVYFITTQELEDRYPGPDAQASGRYAICRKHHTVFLMQIGARPWPPASPTTAARPTTTTGS